MAREIVFAFKADIRNLQQAVERIERQLAQLVSSQNKAAASSRSMGSSFESVVGFAGSAGAAVTGVISVYNRLADVASAAGSAAAGAIKFVANQAADAVNEFAKFEQKQLAVNATMGNTPQQAKAVEDAIKQIGVETKFTIADVQNAALALAQLGTKSDALKGLLKAGSDVATLTFQPLEAESERLLKAMNAFGATGVAQMNKFATVMIQTQTESAASTGLLAEALKPAGSLAKQFGQQIEDVVPALAKLISEGQDAGTSGIVLRTLFTSLIDPTEDAKKAIRGLGLSLGDLRPTEAFKLNDALALMAERGLDIDRAARIFDGRFAAQIVRLTELAQRTKGAGSALDEFKAKILDQDAAQRKVQSTQQGLLFELDKLKATWETAQLQIGGVIARFLNLSGNIAKVQKQFGTFVDTINKLSDKELIEITAKVISSDNLSLVWRDALATTLPALGAAMKEAGLVLLRVLIQGSVVIGELIGRELVEFAVSRLIETGPKMGAAFIEFISGRIADIVKAFTKTARSAADALDPTGTAGAAVFGAGTDAEAAIRKGGIEAAKSLREGANEVAKAVTEALIGPKFNLNRSLNLGDSIADALIGKQAGDVARIPGLIQEAMDGAAKILEERFMRPVDEFAKAVEADKQAKVQQILAKSVETLRGGGLEVPALESVVRDIAGGRLDADAFRRVLESALGQDPFKLEGFRAALEPQRRFNFDGPGFLPSVETLQQTLARLVTEAGKATDFITVSESLAPVLEGLKSADFALSDSMGQLVEALQTQQVELREANKQTVNALNSLRNSLAVLAPGANPQAPGARIIIGTQTNIGSPGRAAIVGPQQTRPGNITGAAAGNQKR